jgi:branched-chain amino acid transport system permease protein
VSVLNSSRTIERLRASFKGRMRSLAAFGLICALLAWVYADSSSSLIYEVNLTLLAAIGALGLNILTGFAGQASIGNAAFLAIGAYTVVLTNGHVPFILILVLGALIPAAVGFVVGLPSLRLGGMYLIFSTLALQYVTAFAFDEYDASHGSGAGHFIPYPRIGDIIFSSAKAWYLLLVCLVALISLFIVNVRRGRWGRAWAALRENEAGAAVMGINVTSAKLLAFALSSAIVGFAGALSAYFVQDVSADYYSVDLAVSYVAMILIGGLGSVPGAIIGAVVVTLLPYGLSNLATSLQGSAFQSIASSAALPQLIYGLAVLLFLLYRPGGIASLGSIRFRHRGPRARAAQPPKHVDQGHSPIPRVRVTEHGHVNGSSAEPPALSVRGMTVGYKAGGVGVSDVDLIVQQRSVTALIGPNGAGKSSTIKGIIGTVRGDPHYVACGSISYYGEDISHTTALERARKGLAVVPDVGKVFSQLTVEENLKLASSHVATDVYARQRDLSIELFPELQPNLKRKAGYLSGGQRQMLAVSLGICSAPRLLVMDEFGLGLSPEMLNILVLGLKRLSSSGLAMLVSGENTSVTHGLADTVYELEAGRIVGVRMAPKIGRVVSSSVKSVPTEEG